MQTESLDVFNGSVSIPLFLYDLAKEPINAKVFGAIIDHLFPMNHENQNYKFESSQAPIRRKLNKKLRRGKYSQLLFCIFAVSVVSNSHHYYSSLSVLL